MLARLEQFDQDASGRDCASSDAYPGGHPTPRQNGGRARSTDLLSESQKIGLLAQNLLRLVVKRAPVGSRVELERSFVVS
jgi:hypothetical protein